MELWIARDKEGNLCLYEKRPVKKDGKILANASGNYYFIDEDLFIEEITFENSPKKIKFELVEARNEISKRFNFNDKIKELENSRDILRAKIKIERQQYKELQNKYLKLIEEVFKG